MADIIKTLGLSNERANSLYKELERFQLPDGTLEPPYELGSNLQFMFKKPKDESYDAVSISVLPGGANIETSLLKEGEYIENVSLRIL